MTPRPASKKKPEFVWLECWPLAKTPLNGYATKAEATTAATIPRRFVALDTLPPSIREMIRRLK